MQRSIVNAVCTLQLKRYLNILRNSVVYAEVEIANVAAPIAGTRDDTVCPTFIFCGRTVMLLIIQKIMWELAYNFVFMAEHKQSGSRGAQFAVCVSCHSTDAMQKILHS